MNQILWNLTGVPAPKTHWFHFRVVDGVEEAPAGPDGQYFGDFWGLNLALEDYDARFLKAHGLDDGNLYKLKDAVFDGNLLKRHQGRLATTVLPPPPSAVRKCPLWVWMATSEAWADAASMVSTSTPQVFLSSFSMFRSFDGRPIELAVRPP